jgi:hypothetical protein
MYCVKKDVAMRLEVIYDSPGDQYVGEREACGHSRKLRAFIKKELETVKAANKLLGAPTIGGGSAWAGGGGGGS